MARWFVLFCFFTFFSCSKSSDTTHFRGWAMTMPYHIIVEGRLSNLEQEKILSIIQSTFDEVNDHYNGFNPHSEISKINKMKSGESVDLSDSLKQLLRFCDQFVQLSEKHFDPTVGSIFFLWKNHFEEKKDIENLLNHEKAIGWDHIRIKENTLRKAHSQTQLDLNAIAKGYAVDLLLDRIQSIGYKNLFVEWGGDLRVLGKHPLRKAWKIQILFPNCEKHLFLYDESCATSGSFMLSRWEKNETTYFHVMDPLTKKPMQISPDRFSYAAVIAPSCAQADALATAALTFPTTREASAWAKQIVKNNPSISFWFYQDRAKPNITVIKSEKVSFF